MKIVTDFNDYQILDMAVGKKIEKWGDYILNRPDPQIIWNEKTNLDIWSAADAIYNRSNTGGGAWDIKNNKLTKPWQVRYKDLTFNLKLMGFKHTGLFPEQAYNWNYIIEKIKLADRKIKVLNLFAYTGGATVAALSAGASVVHVDSSKGMVEWAKENVIASNLENKPVRFLIDDCLKFVKREIRRGNKYDCIIMDPPSYGKGSNKEVWDIEKDLFELVDLCTNLLSDKPLFFLINSYSTGLSMTVLENILKLTVNKKYAGNITADELGIKMNDSELILPCGIFARWEEKK